MPTLRRRAPRRRSDVARRLTNSQHLVLASGLDFPGEPGFDSPEEMKAAWWFHRDRLMEECRPGNRPWGYWEFEVGAHPKSPQYEIDALLERMLDLTPQEKAEFGKEPPRYVPDEVPVPGVIHWRGELPSLRVRAEWHRREGRKEQADAWEAQANKLEKGIEEINNGKNN